MNKEIRKAPVWSWWLLGVISMVISALIKPPSTPTSKPAAKEMNIPLYSTYNFTSVKVPTQLNIPFQPDNWTAVTLPPTVVFRTDPSSDIEIVFIDGSRYIDGPGRQVWYGLKRGIFKIRGLKEAGVLKITLEKKN